MKTPDKTTSILCTPDGVSLETKPHINSPFGQLTYPVPKTPLPMTATIHYRDSLIMAQWPPHQKDIPYMDPWIVARPPKPTPKSARPFWFRKAAITGPQTIKPDPACFNHHHTLTEAEASTCGVLAGAKLPKVPDSSGGSCQCSLPMQDAMRATYQEKPAGTRITPDSGRYTILGLSLNLRPIFDAQSVGHNCGARGLCRRQ